MAKIPYAYEVGSLMYGVVATRAYIVSPMGVVSRYMAMPGKKHWEVVKGIMRYLKGTMHVCIYVGKRNLVLHGFIDSDFARCVGKRNSTTGYIFTLSGGAISMDLLVVDMY